MTLTTKRLIGKKRLSYSTRYLRQIAKVILYHYFDKDIGDCDVRVEYDGISLTVGSTRFRTFRSPPTVPYTLKKTIKRLDKIIEVFRQRNIKKEMIEKTLAPMWKKQMQRGYGVQH